MTSPEITDAAVEARRIVSNILSDLDKAKIGYDAVEEIVSALTAALAAGRAEEAREEIKRQMRRAADAEHLALAYRNMLGEKGLAVAKMWADNGVRRVHFSWWPDAGKLTGEERAQLILDWEYTPGRFVSVDEIDGPPRTSKPSVKVDEFVAALAQSAAPVAPASGGVEAIAAERRRQIEAEGWTTEHDDTHTRGEMAAAAGVYALAAASQNDYRFVLIGSPVNDCLAGAMELWPWEKSWFKPTDRRRDLVKAGALIAAEIDRLDRIPVQQAEVMLAQFAGAPEVDGFPNLILGLRAAADKIEPASRPSQEPGGRDE